jgi:hypothetical protein
MAQSFTTDVTKWQGVDDEPTAGSDNLVKSGGVYNATKDSVLQTNDNSDSELNIGDESGNVLVTFKDLFEMFTKKEEEKEEEPIPDTLTSGNRYAYHNVKTNMTNHFYNNPQPAKEVYSELGETLVLIEAEINR